MKTDDVVEIYADPISQKQPEGKAKLLGHRFDQDEGFHGTMEYWDVEFIGPNCKDEPPVLRQILVPHGEVEA